MELSRPSRGRSLYSYREEHYYRTNGIQGAKMENIRREIFNTMHPMWISMRTKGNLWEHSKEITSDPVWLDTSGMITTTGRCCLIPDAALG
jgi:hypothetical protein